MIPVILAGGSGTRLFPLSRKKFPKQFLKFKGDYSLFQETVLRLKPISEEIIIVSNKDYRFYILDQLNQINFTKYHLLEEPEGRNTAPATAFAIKYTLEKMDLNDQTVLGIFPSDHLIENSELFLQYLKKAEEGAKKGYIVTFGVVPLKPETGYGYIETGSEIGNSVYKVHKFHEKPSLKKAQEYLKQRNFFWNSGMFVFKIDTMLEEFKNYQPEIYEFIMHNTYEDILENFHTLPNISLDYAIMEHTQRAIVIPMNLKWSDLGSWDSLYEALEKDTNNNLKSGEVVDINTKNSTLFSTKRLLATVGLEDVLVIETDDVVLVAKRGEGQRVKDLVDYLSKNSKYKELTQYHKQVFRPWGYYIEFEKNSRYKIKKIVVYPGKSLSLQLHYHRSEHWVVVKGTAKVILEDSSGESRKEYFIHENESIFVPKTTKHRLENPGKVPLEIIEVQVGEYVEEDDIVRFEDNYGRV